MQDLYYFAAWTESGCLLGCDHEHKTVSSAVACTATGSAGPYVVAVEKGKLRQLNETEEVEFQRGMYGIAGAEAVQINLLDRLSLLIRIQIEPKR